MHLVPNLTYLFAQVKYKFLTSHIFLHRQNIPCLWWKPLKHLQSMRISNGDMVHIKIEVKPEIILTGAGGLTVGDWDEAMHDFSPGNNSGGGVGVITEIVENLSNVRYILDRHSEKYIPITRSTMIPMPFRREKAKLRTRSMKSTEQETGYNAEYGGHVDKFITDIIKSVNTQ